MEEIWENYNPATNRSISVNKSRLSDGSYEFYTVEIQDETTNSTNSYILDRKHLKDLFNALGNELGAF